MEEEGRKGHFLLHPNTLISPARWARSVVTLHLRGSIVRRASLTVGDYSVAFLRPIWKLTTGKCFLLFRNIDPKKDTKVQI